MPTDAHSPGARAAGVAAYLDARLAESFDEALRTSWRNGLQAVEALSTTLHGKPFMQASPAERIAVVTKMAEAESAPKARVDQFFVLLKARDDPGLLHVEDRSAAGDGIQGQHDAAGVCGYGCEQVGARVHRCTGARCCAQGAGCTVPCPGARCVARCNRVAGAKALCNVQGGCCAACKVRWPLLSSARSVNRLVGPGCSLAACRCAGGSPGQAQRLVVARRARGARAGGPAAGESESPPAIASA